MHIVQCLTHNAAGGGQQVVLTLARAINAVHPEFRQSVILPPGGPYSPHFRALNLQVIEVPLNALTGRTLLSFLSSIRGLSPDIIHSHGKGAGFYSRSFGGTSVRRIHSFHGFHPPNSQPSRSLYLHLESALSRRTDLFISVSRSEEADILSHLKPALGKTAVIPNVVDRDRILIAGRESVTPAAENFFSRNADKFSVISIGRNDPLKNFPLAVAAAESLLRSSETFCFIFIGASIEGSLESLAEAFPQRVLVLPPLSNVSPYIRRSGALLLTSKKEGSPLTILEGFVHARPVVGTNVPGIRDLVTHEETGLLCAEESGEISAAIQRLSDDRQLYDRLSANADRTSRATSVSGWAEAYSREYLKVISLRVG